MKRATIVLSLATFSAASAFAQHLEVTRNGTRPTILGPDSAYTGRAVADVLFAATKENPVMAVNVTFEPGARTAWHSHHAGQYLIITSGVGWVQERGGKKRVPADLVTDAAAARRLELLWGSCGNEDGLFNISAGVHEYLAGQKIPHKWYIDAGAHTFPVWKNDLYHFASLLFR